MFYIITKRSTERPEVFRGNVCALRDSLHPWDSESGPCPMDVFQKQQRESVSGWTISLGVLAFIRFFRVFIHSITKQ